jgi:hypothetical protein
MQARINNVNVSLMIPTKNKSGWDFNPARDTKVFCERKREFLVVYPTEWSNDEYNALLIDTTTGAVCAIAKEDITEVNHV